MATKVQNISCKCRINLTFSHALSEENIVKSGGIWIQYKEHRGALYLRCENQADYH